MVNELAAAGVVVVESDGQPLPTAETFVETPQSTRSVAQFGSRCPDSTNIDE
jgi:hypothetical protein